MKSLKLPPLPLHDNLTTPLVYSGTNRKAFNCIRSNVFSVPGFSRPILNDRLLYANFRV